MSAPDYTEPLVSFLVLDFQKPKETRMLLTSIKHYVEFPHRVVYLHNGPAADDYPSRFYDEGLIDTFVQTSVNHGLGIGTRDLFALCQSKYAIYVQNDQILGRPFTQTELNRLTDALWQHPRGAASISLAGAPCGSGIYSERAHLIDSAYYHHMEWSVPLPSGGAGPYHHQSWREGAIQAHYRINELVHRTDWPPLFADNGVWTIRDLPCGGRVHMLTDTKAIWWERLPNAPYVFPQLTESEWASSIAGTWVGGTIPDHYLTTKGASFSCWGDVQPPAFSIS